MTEYGLPFDGILLGDATKAPYSADEWARVWKLMHGVGTAFPNYGVFKGSGGGSYEPLYGLATSPASANVEIQIGAALINGRFYETTAAVQLAIAANASGNPRIDTVVLRHDVALQTVRLVVKQGSPAASPSRPTLQQDASFWEIPIIDVAVANGFTTLAQSTITQRQRPVQSSYMGWLPYSFPMVYSIDGDYDSASSSMGTNGVTSIGFAIPFALSANMLLSSVLVRGAGAPYEIGWDLYTQDVNDGNTAENTLRRVAQSDGNTTGSVGVSTNITIPVMGGTIPLEPGLYWLVFQNRHASNSFGLRVRASNSGALAPTAYKSKALPLAGSGATIDLATGWSVATTMPAIRLQGRVFGQSAVY